MRQLLQEVVQIVDILFDLIPHGLLYLNVKVQRETIVLVCPVEDIELFLIVCIRLIVVLDDTGQRAVGKRKSNDSCDHDKGAEHPLQIVCDTDIAVAACCDGGDCPVEGYAVQFNALFPVF